MVDVLGHLVSGRRGACMRRDPTRMALNRRLLRRTVVAGGVVPRVPRAWWRGCWVGSTCGIVLGTVVGFAVGVLVRG